MSKDRQQPSASRSWAERTADELWGGGVLQKGICLVLGASDTGKTTLAGALAKRLAEKRPVGVVDADIGQSHIGPPTTVGWAILNSPEIDFARLEANGIGFVGDVTPARHLLQLTAAVTQCVQQASRLTEVIIIDTPGFVAGAAASALWWTVQQILRPALILAVQREEELSGILAGLGAGDPRTEHVKCPAEIPSKSPEERRTYRQSQFMRYFRQSELYKIRLNDVAVRSNLNLRRERPVQRVVALRDINSIDTAIGQITDWQNEKNIAVIKAPRVDIRQVRCLVIGDAIIDFF